MSLVVVNVVCGCASDSRGQEASTHASRRCKPAHAPRSRDQARGRIELDVDSDGEPDTIELVARYSEPVRCRFVLLLEGSRGTAAMPIGQGISPSTPRNARLTPWPRLVSVIALAQRIPVAVVVTDQGASTLIVRLFDLRDDLIRPLDSSSTTLSVGASGLVASAVDCARGDELVTSFAEYAAGHWSVTRIYYALTDDRLSKSRETEVTAASLAELPEFRQVGNALLLFPSCTTSVAK
jgi:hypothetical protein